MTRRARPLLAALGVVALLVAGCDSGRTPTRAASPTPIARLNTGALDIPLIDFCTLVPSTAVRQALGTRSWERSGYGNGERADVGGGDEEVVAEHGCRWRARAGDAEARAWLFARPVDRRFARSVVRDERHRSGCRPVPGPVFGDPTLTQLCDVDGRTRVRHAGLFGSSWLTCEITDEAATPTVRRRADAWCVEIANALNTSR